MNSNPTLYERVQGEQHVDMDDSTEDQVTTWEIYELIRNIADPEHPLTLEQLNVLEPGLIHIDNEFILVKFTPTIPHCSMATLIGLSIKVQLTRCLSSKFKIKVIINPSTHQSELAINKQVAFINVAERQGKGMCCIGKWTLAQSCRLVSIQEPLLDKRALTLFPNSLFDINDWEF
jgi:metal-sulfur cluster biosynthetic enzyme